MSSLSSSSMAVMSSTCASHDSNLRSAGIAPDRRAADHARNVSHNTGPCSMPSRYWAAIGSPCLCMATGSVTRCYNPHERDLARVARRPPLRRRGVLAAPPATRAETSTSRSASRACSGSERPPAAAARPHVPVGQAEDLHADDGRGAGHAAPARARRDEVLVLRHRRRAQPPLHGPRDRPAGLRRLVQARPRRRPERRTRPRP